MITSLGGFIESISLTSELIEAWLKPDNELARREGIGCEDSFNKWGLKWLVDSSTLSPFNKRGSRYLTIKLEEEIENWASSIPASGSKVDEWIRPCNWVKKQTRYSGIRIIDAEIV